MAAEQRYRVTERLEAGGMAEVFKGESLSVQGFRKQVAIKRVLPHLAQNRNFISMFLDEARLGARLTHANIVTVFDIGAADNTYFIVMEYVDGCNLKTVIEQYRQQGRRIGVKEAVYICVQACAGLSFAHELQDEDGRDLHIVHRDISPPNILLSKRGEVKVTDFGLAKAATQLEKTDPGVVKGKFSYLSPEAALGETVDARTDIFALGIVLWEMLAGRRLFLGETDYQTIKLVQQANVPSLMRLNPEVDAELEAVVMKALARDKNLRYQTAREMGDALSGYLYAKQLKVNSFDIANMVKEVLEAKQAGKAGQPRETSIIDRLIQEELLRFTSLDDLSDPLAPGKKAISPEDLGSNGAQPLDASAFENPADWFSNDPDVHRAVGRAATSPSEPGWRESGVEDAADLASVLEDEPEPMVQPRTVAPPSRQAPEPPALRSDAQVAVPTPAPPTGPQKSGSSAATYVVIAIVLALGAGAAAWFGGFIPH
jgi:serine/threonine-protein kinase